MQAAKTLSPAFSVLLHLQLSDGEEQGGSMYLVPSGAFPLFPSPDNGKGEGSNHLPPMYPSACPADLTMWSVKPATHWAVQVWAGQGRQHLPS